MEFTHQLTTVGHHPLNHNDITVTLYNIIQHDIIKFSLTYNHNKNQRGTSGSYEKIPCHTITARLQTRTIMVPEAPSGRGTVWNILRSHLLKDLTPWLSKPAYILDIFPVSLAIFGVKPPSGLSESTVLNGQKRTVRSSGYVPAEDAVVATVCNVQASCGLHCWRGDITLARLDVEKKAVLFGK